MDNAHTGHTDFDLMYQSAEHYTASHVYVDYDRGVNTFGEVEDVSSLGEE